MSHHHDHADAATKLRTIMKEFRDAILVTLDSRGAPHARPMSVARVEENGDLWFVTSKESTVVRELEDARDVAVTMQSDSRFVSVTGRGQVVRDRKKVDELWQEKWKVWFSEGKDDPSLTLVKVTPGSGEYWDMSGIHGASYLWQAAKAYVTGHDIDGKAAGDHQKVPM